MRSFVYSDLDRDLALALIRTANGQDRYRGGLYKRSETLFAVPQEVADLQIGLVATVLDGNPLLVNFFEATRTASDLSTLGPRYMRWLIDAEVPVPLPRPALLASYLASARDFTTRRIYGDQPDPAAGLAEGKALLAGTRDRTLMTAVLIGLAAHLRAPATAVTLLIEHEGQASGDRRPALHRLAGQLTAMLEACR